MLGDSSGGGPGEENGGSSNRHQARQSWDKGEGGYPLVIVTEAPLAHFFPRSDEAGLSALVKCLGLSVGASTALATARGGRFIMIC
jgi:hypothetical protein